MDRVYISLYFKDLREHGKAKAYLTVSFDSQSSLYEACKKLGSAGIKELLKCDTYKLLKSKATKENRTINNYIKTIISKRLKI